MIGTAWAADKAAKASRARTASSPIRPSGSRVAFVLFFALAGKILWSRVSDMLDKRSAAIAKALADAERLRDEAIEGQAGGRAHAGAGDRRGRGHHRSRRARRPSRMQARAAASLQNAVALREQQALDRIAQSEAAAAKQVRDTAVDVALSATRALLREQVGSGRSEAMVNEAIAELPRRLH